MNFKIIIFGIVGCFYFNAKAQDPIFTQYFVVPETLNPGFSGFEEATYYGVLHRTQWPNLDLRINTEYAFFNTWVENSDSGVGISILNQTENNTNYSQSQINVNYAYIVHLGNDWAFRPALEVGFGIKNLNFSGLTLSDQININSNTINPNSIDPFAPLERRNKSFLDISAGFVFDKQDIYNDTDLWFGFSFKHLNTPNISFVENGNVPLAIFYSIHGSYKFPILDENKLQLTANYMQQGAFNRLDMGANLKFDTLFFGATAATNPAKNDINSHLLTSINTFVGLEYEKLRFGFSYDINTSNIGRTNGVYELSITYTTRCLICTRPAYTERRK